MSTGTIGTIKVRESELRTGHGAVAGGSAGAGGTGFRAFLKRLLAGYCGWRTRAVLSRLTREQLADIGLQYNPHTGRYERDPRV